MNNASKMEEEQTHSGFVYYQVMDTENMLTVPIPIINKNGTFFIVE